jgi:GTP-binding protein Era
MAFRSGFVSIVGRPNAGKSTLLNALLGQKLAIVTHKPQTTRTRVHGVLEVPLKKKTKGEAGHPAAQVVLVDTPGIHKPDTQLDRRMMQEVHDALE